MRAREFQITFTKRAHTHGYFVPSEYTILPMRQKEPERIPEGWGRGLAWLLFRDERTRGEAVGAIDEQPRGRGRGRGPLKLKRFITLILLRL